MSRISLRRAFTNGATFLTGLRAGGGFLSLGLRAVHAATVPFFALTGYSIRFKNHEHH